MKDKISIKHHSGASFEYLVRMPQYVNEIFTAEASPKVSIEINKETGLKEFRQLLVDWAGDNKAYLWIDGGVIFGAVDAIIHIRIEHEGTVFATDSIHVEFIN